MPLPLSLAGTIGLHATDRSLTCIHVALAQIQYTLGGGLHGIQLLIHKSFSLWLDIVLSQAEYATCTCVTALGQITS